MKYKFKHGNIKHSRGVTLIELMVGMVLGLLLLVVVGRIFLNTRQTFSAQDSSARVQENGRYALQRLANALRMAGYRQNILVLKKNAFPTGAVVGTDAAGVSTLTVRYTGSSSGGAINNTVQDCLGNPINASNTVTNTFSLITVGAATTKTLKCDVAYSSGTPPLATGNLVEGIDPVNGFVVRYGVDTTGDSVADTYVAAASVGNWGQVVNATVCVMASSGSETGQHANRIDKVPYTITDCLGQPQVYSDGIRRATFATNVFVRNLGTAGK